MIYERAMELVTALRSGKYRQANGHLRLDDVNGDRSHCCLGVACEISGLSEWIQEEGLSRGRYLDETAVLPARVKEHFGFYSAGGDTRLGTIAIPGMDVQYRCLTEANDKGATFDQIADYIEKNWANL